MLIRIVLLSTLILSLVMFSGCEDKEAANSRVNDINTVSDTPVIIINDIEQSSTITTPNSSNESVTLSSSDEDTATTQEDTSFLDGEEIGLDISWTYADFSAINSGKAVFYAAKENRNNIIIGINAGHGTNGGQSVKTQCHPDGSAKVTGGTTAAGSTTAVAVSGGMTFNDGAAEKNVNLSVAKAFRDILLSRGYDVLMLRDSDDVQLDNIARSVIANNIADCHISIHFDGDGLDYDKGCFYISVPDGIKNMIPVKDNWKKCDALGASLIEGLKNNSAKIYSKGSMGIDLTQTSYSTIPSVDIELGNACSEHNDQSVNRLATGLADGVDLYFN